MDALNDPQNFQDWLTTDCQVCDSKRTEELVARTGDWTDGLSRRMIVCPTCGNKRCPKATWHENECTGSNEPGQPGSSYGPMLMLTPEEREERIRQFFEED